MAKPTPSDADMVREKLRRARLLRSAEREGEPLVERNGLDRFTKDGRHRWHEDRMANGIAK